MKAYELIKDPLDWIQGSFARDSRGTSVSPYSGFACSFCVIGALTRTSYSNQGIFRSANQKLLAYIKDKYAIDIQHLSLTNWNDDPKRTHKEVIEALKACDI